MAAQMIVFMALLPGRQRLDICAGGVANIQLLRFRRSGSFHRCSSDG